MDTYEHMTREELVRLAKSHSEEILSLRARLSGSTTQVNRYKNLYSSERKARIDFMNRIIPGLGIHPVESFAKSDYLSYIEGELSDEIEQLKTVTV